MYGGRLAGQGTYGCVFQPALLCRGKNHAIDSKKVGKVTSHVDARNELEISAYIHTIPESNRYTIIPEQDSCIPRARSKQSETDIDTCGFLQETQIKDTIQLVMPWGGYPMSRINMDPSTFDYYRFVEEVLAVGAFFVLNDLCHFDIWGQNFLFDSNNTPRLIDYGFAFRPSTLKPSDLPMRWRTIDVEHDTETPEVILMVGTQHGLDIHTLGREVRLSKPAVQRLVALCNVNPTHWTEGLIEWAEESKSFQRHDWLSCWKLYWPGFDAWSIGALLLQVLELQIAIPSFTQDSRWTKRSSLIKEVMRGLCRGNPAKRLDAAEALSLWTNGAHPLIADGSPGSVWVQAKQKAKQHIRPRV